MSVQKLGAIVSHQQHLIASSSVTTRHSESNLFLENVSEGMTLSIRRIPCLFRKLPQGPFLKPTAVACIVSTALTTVNE